MDISQDREREEAEAAAAEGQPDASEETQEGAIPGLPPGLELTPDQTAYEAESHARFEAAVEKLGELSRKLPPDQQFGVPEDAPMNATLNLIVELLTERGICAPTEFILRKHRHLAMLAEQAVMHAGAIAEQQSSLVGADGAPLQRGAPPPPPNRAQRRHPRR